MAFYRFINLSFKGHSMHFGIINRANFEQLKNPARIAATLEQIYPGKIILVRGPETAGVFTTILSSNPGLRALAEEFNSAIDGGPALSGFSDGELDC
ncbi:hypothetical protein [Hymenobacter ruricola]|uniref:Uncharacterized protein n=1 Tax=Hymenobacter ruricola TaxID=2791023 RepID=A0ABS0IAJ9_9BACT|nr:hypothetical protein [Hymenobacter ruricola]MBF9223529.1 hypothetical protein [Hymenobacter ruricola]